MSNLVSASGIMGSLQKIKGSASSRNKQEAQKLASHFADLILGKFKESIDLAGLESEKNLNIKIPTGVKANMVIENPELLTEGGISELNNELLSLVNGLGYIAQITRKVDDILRYKELAVEVKVPSEIVSENGYSEYTINLGQLNAEKIAKEKFRNGGDRSQIDYVSLAEEAKQEGVELPLGGYKTSNIGVGMIG